MINGGDPLKVKGSVVDNRGKAVTTFAPMHDGMGFFFLNPAARRILYCEMER